MAREEKRGRRASGGGDTPAASRAREQVEPLPPPTDVLGRVERIEALMRALEWQRGRTNRELAVSWGVSVAVIDDAAAEASRRVRSSLTNPKRVTTTIATRMSRIVHHGEDGDAIKAGDVWSRIVGARAPEKSEITVTAKELEGLPAKALLARIDDQIGKLTAARAKLLDEHPELAAFVVAAPDVGVVRTLDETREGGQLLVTTPEKPE